MKRLAWHGKKCPSRRCKPKLLSVNGFLSVPLVLRRRVLHSDAYVPACGIPAFKRFR